MVRKILSFFYQETAKLHQAAFLLAIFSFGSQVLAFFRDRLLAHNFGASESLDIYYAAFRIPDIIFVTIASMVSLSVLVPFIVERESAGKEGVREFINDIFSFFSLFVVLVCLVVFFFLPKLSPVLFKGLSPESLSELILLSRVLLLSPILLGLSNLFGSLTQAYNRFLVYAFAPMLYNLGIILGTFYFSHDLGIRGVAFGVVLGSFMHLVIQIPFVYKLGLVPRFNWPINFPSIRKVVLLSLPRTLTLSMSQLSQVFLVSLASLMTVGSISVFSFAQNISSVPLTIVGVSYSLAAFPTLSRHFSQNNLKDFVEQMSITVRHIIFWSLPLVALFIVLRAQIVRVLLGTGNFDWSDTRLTAATLAMFSVSVLSQSLSLLFVRAFYSAGHTKKPFVTSIVSTLSIILISYLGVKVFYIWPQFSYFISSMFRVEDLPGTVVLMLPLGFSLGMILNNIVLWIMFEKDFGKFNTETYHTLAVSFASSVFVGLGSYVGLNIFASVFDLGTLTGVFFQGFLSGLLGITVGVLVLLLLRSRELKEFWQAVHQKFKGVEAVAESEDFV